MGAEVPSMALGSLEVRPIDQAAAYATFANDGVYAEPYFIQEVRDRDGKLVLEHEPASSSVGEPLERGGEASCRGRGVGRAGAHVEHDLV